MEKSGGISILEGVSDSHIVIHLKMREHIMNVCTLGDQYGKKREIKSLNTGKS